MTLTDGSRNVFEYGDACRISGKGRENLSRLWEEHCKHEFATRDVKATLDTRVEDAYTFPVPTGEQGGQR
jgi:hypothetical protein